MKPGVLIPVYNHGKTARPLALRFARMGLDVILVDDGSDAETKAELAKAARTRGVVLLALEKNAGKGAAMRAGFEKAHELGMTHAFQIDADGQHDAARVEFFLSSSRKRPEAAVCGYPEYGTDVPPSRLRGRAVANAWARIVTLSADIKDAMIGFRVYPVRETVEILRSSPCDNRMGFDIEILVRLHWAGVPLVFYPVGVTYPEDGISHYHVVRDNLRIVWVFTRLLCGMILRLPVFLWRRFRRKKA